MKVITFLNEKGGVGKTTLASILAATLALDNYRVLAVDGDGQGDLTEAMGLDAAPHFYDFTKRADSVPLVDRDAPERSLVRRVPPDVCPANLSVVSGDAETYGIASNTHTGDIAVALTKRFKVLEKAFDFVIIDTQPSPTPLHEGIMMVTDYVIVPTQAEGFSTKNLHKTVQNITRIHEQMGATGRNKANLLAIVPNMVRANTVLHQEFLSILDEDYGELVCEPIQLRTNIASAQALGTFTLTDAPQLRVNDALWGFSDEMSRRMGVVS